MSIAQSAMGNKLDDLTGSRRLTPGPFFPTQKRVCPPSLFSESLRPQSLLPLELPGGAFLLQRSKEVGGWEGERGGG